MWKWEANIQVLRTFVQVILKNFDLREGLFKALVCCRLRWAALLLLSPGTQTNHDWGHFYTFSHTTNNPISSADWLATPKIQPSKIEPIWANPKILLFWRMRFFNFFFNHMSRLRMVKNINFFGEQAKNYFWPTEKLSFGSRNIFV